MRTKPVKRSGKPSTGLLRSVRLFRLFRTEQRDPQGFYTYLARDTADQVQRYASLSGRILLDVGGGPGHFAAEFRGRGATCIVLDPDLAGLQAAGDQPGGLRAESLVGDGRRLPIADQAVDICFSSNVLEHVDDPARMIGEMLRVTRPGGLIYLSFTNWYSPWGGHEMSPWHYLGAGLAERHYVRRHGRLPKNRPGMGLYPVHVGPTLRLLRSRTDVEILDCLPRYYPRWCRPLVRIPGLREAATWNLVVIMRPIGPAVRRRPREAAGTGTLRPTSLEAPWRR